MTRMALNKSTLHRETARLKTFKKFLPSLDLKRRQLLAAQAKMKKRQDALEEELAQCRALVEDRLSMLADQHARCHDLVGLGEVRLARENLVGVQLPILETLEIRKTDYPLLTQPHWVDHVVDRLETALRLKVELAVQARRLVLIEEAVRRTTQRLNLFEKVLIPQAKGNIKKIAIFLSDLERAAVVRSKFAKSKRAREAS